LKACTDQRALAFVLLVVLVLDFLPYFEDEEDEHE